MVRIFGKEGGSRRYYKYWKVIVNLGPKSFTVVGKSLTEEEAYNLYKTIIDELEDRTNKRLFLEVEIEDGRYIHRESFMKDKIFSVEMWRS